MSRVNIIPMAGLGSRFSDSGYVLPKPLILVSGRPMIINAIRHMPYAEKWIFLVRREHIENYNIDKVIKKEISHATIIPIDGPTDGQASTCMLAMDHIDMGDSIFIAACDNAFIYNKKKYTTLLNDPKNDCIVWTFTDDELLEVSPKSWGWVKLRDDGQTIANMSVKIPVSDTPRNDHAVVASFFFRRAQDFVDAYDRMVGENYRINNEFYIDSMPIFLNKMNKKSVIFDVDLYVGWGKPTDLYAYDLKEYKNKYGLLDDNNVNKKWNKFFKLHARSTLFKEISRFFVVGCSAVACDFAVYMLLINFLHHSPSKAISFLCGTTLAYVFNKNWTFSKKGVNHKEMLLFFTLYGFTLLVNVAVNAVSITFGAGLLLAFIFATGTSTVLNFIGQKWIVFR